MGPGKRKLDALILSDRTPEDYAVSRVPTGPVNEPAPVADTLGRDQNPLCVQTVEQLPEAFPLFTDPVLDRYFELIEEDFGSGVINHCANRHHGHAVANRALEVNQKH